MAGDILRGRGLAVGNFLMQEQASTCMHARMRVRPW